jgi:riboflavin biosynthesis pyrimidine reductase
VILRRVFPEPTKAIELDDAGSRAQIADLYRPPRSPWLRLNFIASVSGNVVGSDGTSEKLSNPVDRRILGIIRELADVVLIGAGSLRTEGYLRPRNARLAVVTASGNLATESIDKASAADPLIVFCPPSATARVRTSLGEMPVDIVELPETNGQLSPREIAEALRGRGLTSIVCEGGPKLARQFVEAGIVDEICLSTSPVVNGASLPFLGAAQFAERQLTLTQLLIDEASGLYACWAVLQS